MFLDKTIKTRPELIKQVLDLYDEGKVLPDSYILDVDKIVSNAKLMKHEADKYGIELFFMLKQIGRNPIIARKLMDVGYAGAVVVDYKEALVMIENDIKIGNVGHLVQVPIHVLEKIILAKPEYITVFSFDIMNQVEDICKKHDLVQKVYLKVIDLELDNIYEGQFGGFEFNHLDDLIPEFKKYKNIDIAGLTSFPCILQDENGNFGKTNNSDTLAKTKQKLEENGFEIRLMNLPSATSSYSMKLLSEIGATHGEPGHGLTGTTPYHNQIDFGEEVAMLYVSEISHSLNGVSYCYGGGHYRRSHMSNCLIDNKVFKVTPPSLEAIDYYFEIEGTHPYGKPVLMNFRTQIFVTRSDVVLLEGVESGHPNILGVYDAFGKKIQ